MSQDSITFFFFLLWNIIYFVCLLFFWSDLGVKSLNKDYSTDNQMNQVESVILTKCYQLMCCSAPYGNRCMYIKLNTAVKSLWLLL